MQTPSAVLGDFNADGMPDMAMLGHNKTHEKRIVLLSGAKGYSVLELLRPFPIDENTRNAIKIGRGRSEVYLELIPPSKIKAKPAYERPELDLKTDAFVLGHFEKASSIYVYDNGKFIHYALSD